MSAIRIADADGIQVVVCCSFNHRADLAEIEALKQRVIACEHVRHSMEVSGAFDFMIDAVIEDLPTYNAKRKSYAEDLAKLVERFEASFVCRRFIRADVEEEDSFWIPSSGGLRRIDVSAIDKVTSEGDYVRIHHDGQSSLMHGTMGKVLDKLDPAEFLHIHRTMIVRCGFIDRLTHQPHRWFAELADGSRQRISKGHVAHVLRSVKGDSATPVNGSAMRTTVTEYSGRFTEDRVRSA